MHVYSIMREFADSWALLGLVLVFLCIIAWAYRPGSRKVRFFPEDASARTRKATVLSSMPTMRSFEIATRWV